MSYDDALDAGRHRGVDRAPVQPHPVGILARGDEEDRLEPGERLGHGLRVAVVARHGDLHAGQARRASGVADDQALCEPAIGDAARDPAADLARGARDADRTLPGHFTSPRSRASPSRSAAW